jgi:hypothetical protein
MPKVKSGTFSIEKFYSAANQKTPINFSLFKFDPKSDQFKLTKSGKFMNVLTLGSLSKIKKNCIKELEKGNRNPFNEILLLTDKKNQARYNFYKKISKEEREWLRSIFAGSPKLETVILKLNSSKFETNPELSPEIARKLLSSNPKDVASLLENCKFLKPELISNLLSYNIFFDPKKSIGILKEMSPAKSALILLPTGRNIQDDIIFKIAQKETGKATLIKEKLENLRKIREESHLKTLQENQSRYGSYTSDPEDQKRIASTFSRNEKIEKLINKLPLSSEIKLSSLLLAEISDVFSSENSEDIAFLFEKINLFSPDRIAQIVNVETVFTLDMTSEIIALMHPTKSTQILKSTNDVIKDKIFSKLQEKNPEKLAEILRKTTLLLD